MPSRLMRENIDEFSKAIAYALLFFFIFSGLALAYVPPSKVPIQGRLTNASTGAALSGIYNFTFRVYNATSGGTMLWEENQSLLLDSGGLWNTFLGNNTALSMNFSEDTYIEIEINHDGNPLPRVQLATVPYSKRTDIAANLSCTDCITGTEINESTLSGVNASQLQGQWSGYYLNTSTPYSYWTNQTLSSRNNITDLNVSVGFQFTSANSNQLQGQASGYYLNTSTPFGGDVYGSYNSIKVNASKIDNGTLNRSYIEDAYLLNTGDNATGNYTINGSLRVDNATGSAVLYVNASNGNVGIGTTSPGSLLHVYSSTASYASQLVKIQKNLGTNDSSASQHGWQLELSKQSDGKSLALGVLDNGVGVIQAKEWGVGYQSLALNPISGNVGIGTTSPGAKLHISGGGILLDNDQNFYIKDSGGTARSVFFVDTGNDLVFDTGNAFTGVFFDLKSGGDFYIRNSSDAGLVRIQETTGYVGIGTASPGAKLDVVTPDNSVRNIRVHNTNTGANQHSGIQFSNSIYANSFSLIYGYPTADSLTFHADAGSTPFVMVLDHSSGNVGIGTASPGSALTVGTGGDATLSFTQIDWGTGGTPASTSCDEDSERGRLWLDATNNYLFVCNGATRGWDYVALTN